MRFTGLVTQGASRLGYAEFIKAFKVASSLDGRTYTVYRAEGERSDHVSTASICPPVPLSDTVSVDSRPVRRSLRVMWTTTEPRLTCLTRPSSASISGSSRWSAAGRARYAWSWWAASSTVRPTATLSPMLTLMKTLTPTGSAAGCSEPMGMKSRLVSNRQITASSAFSTWGVQAFTWHSHYARLDKQGKTNAWTAATNDRSEWLQVR